MDLIEKFIEYLRIERSYSEHTCISYRNDLTDFSNFLKEHFNVNTVHAQKNHIRAWIVNLLEKNYNPSTVNRKISALKSFYEYTAKISETETNPVKSVKSIKKPKRYVLPFSEDEMQRYLSSGSGILNRDKTRFKPLRDYVVIEILYGTGMRRSELVNLRIRDLDLTSQTVKISGKRNKQRIVPLLPSLVELLSAYLALLKEIHPAAEYVITNDKGEKAYPGLIYRIVRSQFEGISTKEKKSPHVIRHAFATHLLDRGVNLQEVKELLGHAGLASTQVYTHTSLKHLKNVYNKSHPRNRNK